MWAASLWKLCKKLVYTRFSEYMVNFRVKRECQLIAAPQTWIALVDGMIKSIYWFLSIKDVPDTATIIIYFQWYWKLSDQVAVWLPKTSQIFGRKPNLPLDRLDWGNWRYFKFSFFSNQKVYVQIQFSCMLESNERFNTDVSQADLIKCQKLSLPSASSQSSSTSCSLLSSFQRKSSDNRFTRSLIARSNSVIRQNLIYFSCSNGHWIAPLTLNCTKIITFEIK